MIPRGSRPRALSRSIIGIRSQWPAPSTPKQAGQLHAQMVVTGASRHPPALAHLMICISDPNGGDDLEQSFRVFSYVPSPSTFLWNTLIRACCLKEATAESVRIYRRMKQEGVGIDAFTFCYVFRACGLSSAREGETVHGNFLRSFPEGDPLVGNSLIHMYSELGLIELARKAFEGISPKDVISWTTIMGGYAKSGDLEKAQQLFDEMPERNVVSWTSLITGYSQAGLPSRAVQVFKSMLSANVVPDSVAIIAVLSACSQLKDLELGKWIYSIIDDHDIRMGRNLCVSMIDMFSKCGDLTSARRIFDSTDGKNLPACNAMIDGYCKLGNVEEARLIFDQMTSCDLISFNSIIAGYVQNCEIRDAIGVFSELRRMGLNPDNVTMVSLLAACASLAALQQGRAIHAHALVSSIWVDLHLGTSLLDMYAKCGRIDDARHVFDKMPDKDLLSWTAIISGFSLHGKGRTALDYFSSMKKQGIKPNGVAYVAVLTACSHSGLVSEGYHHFKEMRIIFGIEPEIEHYGCMIDLLSRCGRLREAEELMKTMPMEPNAVIWSSFLAACRFHGDIRLAEKAAQQLLLLEPHEDAGYVQLCNVYASSGLGESSSEIRRVMEERGVKKKAGCSSVVVNGEVHEFIAGERSHPEIARIREMMSEMGRRMRAAGYVSETWRVVVDMDEEEKEQSLEAHSERMAIAFGLMKTGATHCPLQILKNLRTCEECHRAIKLISKIWNRTIIIRDRSRFHHFTDGLCSCNDFW